MEQLLAECDRSGATGAGGRGDGSAVLGAYDNFHEHDQQLTYYGLLKNTDHIYSPKKRYYAAKQLYRFVRPGDERIGLKADIPGLTAAAFRHGADGSVVVVGAKQGGPDRIRFAGADVGTWEVWQTTRVLDCTKTDTIAVRDGAAEIPLAGDTILTLVGKAAR